MLAKFNINGVHPPDLSIWPMAAALKCAEYLTRPPSSILSKRQNMANAPIFKEMDRKSKVYDIIQPILAIHKLNDALDMTKIHINDKFICEYTGEYTLSNAIIDFMFPKLLQKCNLFHYTGIDGLDGIISSGEIRLYPVRNRLGQGGELEAFATEHNLNGYFENSQGEELYKKFSDDLFYASFTTIPPRDPQLMWGVFSKGNGVRLEFSITPGLAELRPIHYQYNGSRTLLKEINTALVNHGMPPFVPWGISRIGAFYLAGSVSNENEVRLLVKRYPEGYDETRNNGAYWPIKLSANNPACDLDLVGIHLAPSAVKSDVESLLKGTKFSEVPITGPDP